MAFTAHSLLIPCVDWHNFWVSTKYKQGLLYYANENAHPYLFIIFPIYIPWHTCLAALTFLFLWSIYLKLFQLHVSAILKKYDLTIPVPNNCHSEVANISLEFSPWLPRAAYHSLLSIWFVGLFEDLIRQRRVGSQQIGLGWKPQGWRVVVARYVFSSTLRQQWYIYNIYIYIEYMYSI